MQILIRHFALNYHFRIGAASDTHSVILFQGYISSFFVAAHVGPYICLWNPFFLQVARILAWQSNNRTFSPHIQLQTARRKLCILPFRGTAEYLVYCIPAMLVGVTYSNLTLIRIGCCTVQHFDKVYSNTGSLK